MDLATERADFLAFIKEILMKEELVAIILMPTKKEVRSMIIDYSKLWKLMIDKKINKTQLREMAQISTNAIAKLGKNEPVAMETLDKICNALDCGIGDIMEFVHDNSNNRIETGGQDE